MNWLDRMRALASRPPAPRGRGASGPVRTTIEFDREPPAAWQAVLDAAHVPGAARLVVAWEPGDRWQPVNRWMVWQLQAWEHVDDAVKRELRGPSPRTNAELRYITATINGTNELRPRVFGGPCQLIDRRTWALHREIADRTGELVRPRRLWVCQGDDGGHPFQISTEEQALRALQGKSADVPSAGDLPFAAFDARVLRALERYDLWRWANRLSDNPITGSVRQHITRLREIEIDANRLRWQQWDDYAGEIAGEMAHAARKDGLHRLRLRPVGEKARGSDYGRAEHAYIHDTNLEAVR